MKLCCDGLIGALYGLIITDIMAEFTVGMVGPAILLTVWMGLIQFPIHIDL